MKTNLILQKLDKMIQPRKMLKLRLALTHSVLFNNPLSAQWDAVISADKSEECEVLLP